MVAAPYHTLFVKKDGSLWGMGYNGTGALGNGSSYEDYRDIDYDGQRESIEPTPIRIASAEVVNVAGARFATLFVKEDGSL